MRVRTEWRGGSQIQEVSSASGSCRRERRDASRRGFPTTWLSSSSPPPSAGSETRRKPRLATPSSPSFPRAQYPNMLRSFSMATGGMPGANISR